MRPPHNRTHLHLPTGFSERLADIVVRGLGSWRYIVIQTSLLLLWDGLNLAGILHADPWPLIFTNLLLSLQAAYASPLILMAGNRAASRDRARDDLESEEVAALYEINKEQLEILRLLRVLVKERE